jgi:hypothetical protein
LDERGAEWNGRIGSAKSAAAGHGRARLGLIGLAGLEGRRIRFGGLLFFDVCFELLAQEIVVAIRAGQVYFTDRRI